MAEVRKFREENEITTPSNRLEHTSALRAGETRAVALAVTPAVALAVAPVDGTSRRDFGVARTRPCIVLPLTRSLSRQLPVFKYVLDICTNRSVKSRKIRSFVGVLITPEYYIAINPYFKILTINLYFSLYSKEFISINEQIIITIIVVLGIQAG